MERTERGRMRLSLEGERVPTDGEFAGAPGGGEARNRRVLETQVREPGRAGCQTEVINWERTVTELNIFLKSLNLANVMAEEGGVIPRSAQRISREGAPRSSSSSRRASRRTMSRGWHNEDGRPRSSPAKVSLGIRNALIRSSFRGRETEVVDRIGRKELRRDLQTFTLSATISLRERMSLNLTPMCLYEETTETGRPWRRIGEDTRESRST